MKRAVSNIAWAPEARLEAYDLLAATGTGGLEIAPGLFFHAAGDPFDPEPAVARAALDEIAGAGLSLVSMQSLLFGVEGAALFGPPEALQRFEHGMTRAIDLAGRFGIPNLVFGSPGQRRIPEGMAPGHAADHAATVFRRLGDRARAAGTVIAIESNPPAYGTNFANTLEEAHAIVRHTGHPAVTLILDLGAMHMNGQFGAIARHVAEAAPALSHVHVSEPQLAPAPADAAAAAAALGALGRAGYDRAVSIEMKPPPDGLAGIAACLGRLGEAFAAAGIAAGPRGDPSGPEEHAP